MPGITKSEKPLSFEDSAKLEGYKCRANRELRFAGMFVLVISIILPFLPPKYSGQKAMLDIMSYSQAVAGIVSVFAVVFLWAVYYMLYGIYKDLKEKIKIVLTTVVVSVNNNKYKGRNYKTFSAAGMPYRLGRVNITENEADELKPGDPVVIEYSKYGKKLLGWRSVDRLNG